MIVVNKDLQFSTAFSVKFKPAGEVMVTNAYNGSSHAWAGEQNWLAPGQGMLLSIKQ